MYVREWIDGWMYECMPFWEYTCSRTGAYEGTDIQIKYTKDYLRYLGSDGVGGSRRPRSLVGTDKKDAAHQPGHGNATTGVGIGVGAGAGASQVNLTAQLL